MGVRFIIDVPANSRESDINTLVLNVSELKNELENPMRDDVWVEVINDKIERMKQTLDNIKIKRLGGI